MNTYMKGRSFVSLLIWSIYVCDNTKPRKRPKQKKDLTSITRLDILPGVHGSTAKLDKPQDFWNNFFQKDKAKVEIICP